MCILNSCWCFGRISVRKGSFISAVYTILYFFAFAVLTGSMAYLDFRTWTSVTPDSDGSSKNSTGSGTNPLDTITPSYNEIEQTKKEQAVNFNSAHDPATTQSAPMSLVIILLDFACEIFGFISAIILIVGLHQERKLFLIPWMIIVPVHTLIDIYTVCDIAAGYLGSSKASEAEPGQDSYGALILFVAVSITATINMYALLCVFSQYMEYRAGRGTAAHENLLCGVRGSSGQGSFRGGRPNQKSDIWCDDLIFNQTKNSNCKDIPMSLLERPDSKKTRGERVPTVRFENETSSSSGDCGEPHLKLMSTRCSYDNFTSCRNLSVPSTCSHKRGGYCTPTLIEEQSTTADSIEEI